MVEDVVKDKIKYFNLEHFVADRAYNSKRVLSFINEMGITPIIPFKRGTTGKDKKYPIFQQMFQFFTQNHQTYMRIYHARSNIETAFFGLKQRFGDHLMTKTLVANTNEIKAKILCYNLCCLLTEVMECGISVDFESCVKKINFV